MRAWFDYLFILLVSILWGALPAFAVSATTKHFPKLTVVQASAVEQNSRSPHCDQLEDIEVITAAYTQHSAIGPGVFTIYNELKGLIYPDAAIRLETGRDNALIQPFYKLILFPFHVFW